MDHQQTALEVQIVDHQQLEPEPVKINIKTLSHKFENPYICTLILLKEAQKPIGYIARHKQQGVSEDPHLQ